MVVTILSLVIALSILVFVHELGHYVAAKKSNVVVEEFGFGYTPRIFSFWHTKGKTRKRNDWDVRVSLCTENSGIRLTSGAGSSFLAQRLSTWANMTRLTQSCKKARSS